jgi:hypothetical protein
VTQTGITDMPESAFSGRNDALPMQRPVTSTQPAYAGNSGATWQNGPFTHQPQPVGHVPLSAAGVMSPEFARVPIPDQGRWLVHVIPLLGAVAIDWSGFWSNAEPDHAGIAALLAVLGSAGILSAIVAAVATVLPSKSATEIRDSTATRMVAGGGVGLLSLSAMMGTGVSGTGCIGALTTVAGAYIGWAGWIGHRRKGNQNVVIEIARAAAAAQSQTYAPQPPPEQAYLPGPSNPYEARVLSALEAMGYAGASAGAPKAIGDDAWKIRVALPKGRNNSPDKLITQAEVLASNMESRRVEVETHGSNIVDITAFDGPDTLGKEYRYPWDGTVLESLNDPMAIAIDDAGRILEIVFNDHLLISGKTGGGKSKLVRLILARTLGARDVVRFGIDCKPGAVELGMFEAAMHMLAKNSLDGVRMHHGLKAMIAERGLILEENGDDEWRTEYGPLFVVASDERAVITRDFPDCALLIEENMQMMRFVGGKTADATQTPSGGVYGKKTDARHQYGIRIGFYNESTVNTMVFGGKASTEGWRLEKLENAPGKMLMRSYGNNVPRPYKSLWAERAEILELIEKYADGFEPLDARSAAAFAAGMEAFDMQEEENATPPSGGGRRKRSDDPIETAQAYYTKPYLVRKYPDGSTMSEARALLWDALAEFPDGFMYRDIAARDLDGYGSRSAVQGPLDIWRAKGWVTELRKDGNAVVFVRCAHDDDQRRKEA